MPVEMSRIARIVDDPALQPGIEPVVPGHREEGATVLPEPAGEVPFERVEGELGRPGVHAEVGDPLGHLGRETRIGKKHAVAVVCQHSDLGVSCVGRCSGSPRAARAAGKAPGGGGADPFVSHQLLPESDGVQNRVLPEEQGIVYRDLGLLRVDGVRERRRSDSGQPPVRNRRDVGIVGRDEVGQRVKADADAVLRGCVHARPEAVPTVRKQVRLQLEVAPRRERRTVVQMGQARPSGQVQSLAYRVLAEVDDEAGRGRRVRLLRPRPADDRVRKSLGQFDPSDRVERLFRRTAEQGDPAADDAAIVVRRRRIRPVTPVRNHPLDVTVAAVRLQHAPERRRLRRVAANELLPGEIGGQVGVVARIEQGRSRRPRRPPSSGIRPASWG